MLHQLDSLREICYQKNIDYLAIFSANLSAVGVLSWVVVRGSQNPCGESLLRYFSPRAIILHQWIVLTQHEGQTGRRVFSGREPLPPSPCEEGGGSLNDYHIRQKGGANR